VALVLFGRNCKCSFEGYQIVALDSHGNSLKKYMVSPVNIRVMNEFWRRERDWSKRMHISVSGIYGHCIRQAAVLFSAHV